MALAKSSKTNKLRRWFARLRIDDGAACDSSITNPALMHTTSSCSRLLQLPGELRTAIYHYVLILPSSQKLTYHCLHTHPTSDKVPSESTHSNHDSACGHVKVLSPMLRDYAALLRVSRAVHSETAGMIASLHTVNFPDVDRLRCFIVAQREAILSTIDPAERALRGINLRSLRTLELSMRAYQLPRVVDALLALPALETATLFVVHFGTFGERVHDLLRLTHGAVLPRLKSCELVVTLDPAGTCEICRFEGCVVWKHLVEGELQLVRRVNGVVADALERRRVVWRVAGFHV